MGLMRQHFTPALFEFLIDLRENNNREWFQANKSRYEHHVKEPLLGFIEDFGPLLHSISGHFVADTRTNGGSMFRIYRDVRFSKDKSPYKTQAAAHFRHEIGRSAHAPGFYLHLAPGEVFAGVGLWHPDSTSLSQIRSRIASEPELWERTLTGKAFRAAFELSGDSLKRPPKGFDADHRHIEHLKRKDHIAMCAYDEAEATEPGFLDDFADTCRAASPYMEFLTTSIGLAY